MRDYIPIHYYIVMVCIWPYYVYIGMGNEIEGETHAHDVRSTLYTGSNERESNNETENFDAGAMVLETLTTCSLFHIAQWAYVFV